MGFAREVIMRPASSCHSPSRADDVCLGSRKGNVAARGTPTGPRFLGYVKCDSAQTRSARRGMNETTFFMPSLPTLLASIAWRKHSKLDSRAGICLFKVLLQPAVFIPKRTAFGRRETPWAVAIVVPSCLYGTTQRGLVRTGAAKSTWDDVATLVKSPERETAPDPGAGQSCVADAFQPVDY